MPSSSTSGRGGWWVVAQFALMAVILGLGIVPPIWPDWVRALGIAVTLAGAALGIWAGRTLGSSLTAFPRPRADGELVERGPYAIVRHPIYTAGTLFFLGYGLLASIPATSAWLPLPPCGTSRPRSRSAISPSSSRRTRTTAAESAGGSFRTSSRSRAD